MAPDIAQLEELGQFCGAVAYAHDGGLLYLLLQQLRLLDGCEPTVVDALLCPGPRDGYSSRLFFAEKIHIPVARNWGVHRILDRNWHAFSWQTQQTPKRYAQILAIHLRALQ